MSTSTIINSNNPIGLHHSGPITQQQTRAYDTLLTQLAKVLSNLQVQAQMVSSDHFDSNHSYLTSIACWQAILEDLSTIVLPEFYVVFHDSTANAMQKRRLYDMTQTIHFYMMSYEKSNFSSQLMPPNATKNKLFNDNDAILKATLYQSLKNNTDNYITGNGVNVKVAYQLSSVAKRVDVDCFYYLDNFDDYYQILIDKQRLLEKLAKIPLRELTDQLKSWTHKRQLAFQSLYANSSQRVLVDYKATSTHPLDLYLSNLNLYREVAHRPEPTKVIEPSVPLSELLAPQADYPKGPFLTKPKQFIWNAGLASVGSIILGMASFDPINIFVLFGAVYFCCIWLIAHSIIDSIDAKQHAPFVQIGSLIVSVLSIPMLLSGGLLTGIGIHTLILAIWLKVRSPDIPLDKIILLPFDAILKRNSQSSVSISQKPRKNLPPVGATPVSKDDRHLAVYERSNTIPKGVKSVDKPSAKSPNADIETDANKTRYRLPLAMERHGYHLAILLSKLPTQHLHNLIDAANTLHSHVDYLQTAHPYLATRVDEMIKDLAYNTIVRLDETASNFVKNGQVSDDVREMFKQQHEARIDELLQLNLEQVNDLNQSILQKQMAGFANVDSPEERQFRDTLMELKIVLRWLIAQQPDEVQASSHQVILDNLESSTLADMQAVFFEQKTTTIQREELQSQLDKLLTHFKQQTTAHIQLNSAHQDDIEMQELLQLSQPNVAVHNSANQDLTTDDKATLLKNQKFIEFNKHYVDQLLSHWH